MGFQKVTAFKKRLIVESANKHGVIMFRFGRSESKTLRLDLSEFLCLSHILEHDYVFYDPEREVFATEDELRQVRRPTNIIT